MEINKKKEIVTGLHEDFKKSAIVIATDYKGLDVAAVTKLRSELTKAEIDFRVVKNPLKCPEMRPALPLKSSRASGFFFCGIRELPVL